jgi:uncharacterized membrane protein YeaQ/YmgE (transglycosylase-associated protein family)
VISTILWALIGGTVIGFLGKALARSGPDLPLYATVLCGVAGVLLGNWVYVDVLGFQAQTTGLDWWRHGWQIGAAALLVALADLASTLRHGRHRPRAVR